MRIAYRGNFGVSFSTESHVAASLEHMGHDVIRLQEDTVSWSETLAAVAKWHADLFLWTSTHSYAHKWDQDEAMRSVRALNAMLPTAALHLDLFFGLARASQVVTEPWFYLRHVFTADGDHDAEFKAAGVNHHWLLPGVYHAECTPGTPRPEFAADVGFVGCWSDGYHEEWWPQRKRLVDFLRARYGDRLALWPALGHGAVRGQDLNDLYASIKVVVGDSCFADRSKRYTSDRVYETVGRGGFLIYPRIAAVEAELRAGEHLLYYTHGDLDELEQRIDGSLAEPDLRQQIQYAGQAHVRAHCTYLNRLQAMLDVVGVGA